MIVYIYHQHTYDVKGSLLLKRDPKHEISAYGYQYDSHWWDIDSEQRQRAWPAFDISESASVDTLNPVCYAPTELALCMSHHLIKDLEFGYTTLTQASRDDGLIPSETFFDECFEMLINQDMDFLSSIQFDLETYKSKTAWMSKKAIWHLDMMVRLEGHSDFTDYARRVLLDGLRDFKVLAYFANKIAKYDAAHTHLKTPKKPFVFQTPKAADLPGIWQVRKIKPYFSFYGDQVYVICANEHNEGVCFSISPDNYKEAGFQLGSVVNIRARVAGEPKDGLLPLNYVKVTLPNG